MFSPFLDVIERGLKGYYRMTRDFEREREKERKKDLIKELEESFEKEFMFHLQEIVPNVDLNDEYAFELAWDKASKKSLSLTWDRAMMWDRANKVSTSKAISAPKPIPNFLENNASNYLMDQVIRYAINACLIRLHSRGYTDLEQCKKLLVEAIPDLKDFLNSSQFTIMVFDEKNKVLQITL